MCQVKWSRIDRVESGLIRPGHVGATWSDLSRSDESESRSRIGDLRARIDRIGRIGDPGSTGAEI